jgi:hypothetical protein
LIAARCTWQIEKGYVYVAPMGRKRRRGVKTDVVRHAPESRDSATNTGIGGFIWIEAGADVGHIQGRCGNTALRWPAGGGFNRRRRFASNDRGFN